MLLLIFALLNAIMIPLQIIVGAYQTIPFSVIAMVGCIAVYKQTR